VSTHVDIVQAFKCSHCQTLYLDEQAAGKCYRKCHHKHLVNLRMKKIEAQREVLSDMPRVEAESFSHAWELVEKYAREKMKISFKLKKADMYFQVVSNTHCAPIGGESNWHGKNNLPKGYLGWCGNIEGDIKILKRFPQKDRYRDLDLRSVLGDRNFSSYSAGFSFRGFHSGTGCPAAKFEIGFSMFLDDFPKIHKRYLRLCKESMVVSRLMDKEADILKKEFNGVCDLTNLLHKKPQVC
jgi:hypothetical protein